MATGGPATGARVVNVSGGRRPRVSLRQFSEWCAERFGPHTCPTVAGTRPFDVPWLVLDSVARRDHGTGRQRRLATTIFEEIATHAEAHPDWLESERMTEAPPAPDAAPLTLLSVVIPARDEEGCIAATVEHLHLELRLHGSPARDRRRRRRQHRRDLADSCSGLAAGIPELRPLRNDGPHGFGRAVVYGLDHIRGDAVVIMMADDRTTAATSSRYWQTLNEGWDCVFGSRFIKGGGVIDYPWIKRIVNRLANRLIMRRCSASG